MIDYYDDELTVYELVRQVFCAGAVVWMLLLIRRIARGTMLSARVRAYDELADAYTAEEREVLIHKIKRESVSR